MTYQSNCREEFKRTRGAPMTRGIGECIFYSHEGACTSKYGKIKSSLRHFRAGRVTNCGEPTHFRYLMRPCGASCLAIHGPHLSCRSVRLTESFPRQFAPLRCRRAQQAHAKEVTPSDTLLIQDSSMGSQNYGRTDGDQVSQLPEKPPNGSNCNPSRTPRPLTEDSPSPYQRTQGTSDSPALHPSVYSVWWEMCTVRGWSDGSIVYKFDQLDGAGDEVSAAGGQQPTWSNALRLGVKFKRHIGLTATKLSEYIKEWDGTRVPTRLELKRSQYKTWEKVARQAGLLPGSTGESKSQSEDEHESSSEEDTGASSAAQIVSWDLSSGAADEESIQNDYDSNPAPESEQPTSHSEADARYAPRSSSHTQNNEQQVPEAGTRGMSSWMESLFRVWKAWVIRQAHVLVALGTAAVCASMMMPLTLYRFLPYYFRRIFHSSWPPKVETGHVSPLVARLLAEPSSLSRRTLERAGFDPQGRRFTK